MNEYYLICSILVLVLVKHSQQQFGQFNGFGYNFPTTPYSNGPWNAINFNSFNIPQKNFNINPGLRVNNYAPNPTSSLQDNYAQMSDSDICGPTVFEDKIYGGNDTGLDEFPWMALLQYKKMNNDPTFGCGGMLINKNYVLTAAHCVSGDVTKELGALINVRLGEWNTDTDPDCVQYNSGKECAPSPQDIGVRKVVSHPGFSQNNHNFHDDIGLVNLIRSVTYTDYIKPICLPSFQLRSLPNEEVVVAGWGRTLSSKRSSTKQKLSIRIVDNDECSEKFRSRNCTINYNQICAGGKFREDTCDGDSGGPLMSNRGGSWFVEGIVSYGFRCGLEGWPAIYTRVNSYNDWIQQNILN